MRQLKPPMSAAPSLFSSKETDFIILVFAEKKGPIEIEYVK
jgi:hypothetical protein